LGDPARVADACAFETDPKWRDVCAAATEAVARRLLLDSPEFAVEVDESSSAHA